MRIAWRVLLVLAVFAGVGLAANRLLIAYAVARGTPEYEVRLAGAMGGLFVGGAAAVIVAIVLFATRRRLPPNPDRDSR